MDPVRTYPRDLDYIQAVEKACLEPTLADALSWIAIWESERAIKQAKTFFETGVRTPEGYGWETCFKVLFLKVLEKYPKEK